MADSVAFDKFFNRIGSPLSDGQRVKFGESDAKSLSDIQPQDNVNSIEFANNYEVPDGFLNYYNMTPSARAYTGVLSLSREKGSFRSLQEALNYINKQGGGRLIVQPGTYSIGTTITMPANISIEGLQPRGAVFDFGTASNYFNISNSTNEIKLSNLTFNHSTNSNGCIYLANSARIKLDNCFFGTNTCDIYSGTCSLITITNCSSYSSGNFYNGANTNAGDTNFINNCRILNPTSYTFLNFNNMTISNCLISNPGTTPFYGFIRDSYICGNLISTPSRYAVEFLNGNDNTIIGNDFGCAMYVGTVDDVYITNNHLVSNTGTTPVIAVLGGFAISITGNAMGCGTQSNIDGINFSSSAADTLVTGNYIRTQSAASGYAVNIDNTCSRIAVVANRLQGQTGATHDLGTGDVIANNS